MQKKFILKCLFFVFALIAIFCVLLFAIPKDNNAYLCEYNKKLALLENTPQPRIILVGGSNIALGVDSKTLKDSLNINVVNFGLHAGIGIRIPFEDCLNYVRKGDIVIAQFEYKHFQGGYGEPETLPAFMIATDWIYSSKLSFNQWKSVLNGIPTIALLQVKRLIKYPLNKSFDSPKVNKKYEYIASGFNEYGDEASHLLFPSEKLTITGGSKVYQVDNNFMEWLAAIIYKYEQAGAEVIMLPPVCVKSFFEDIETNTKSIAEALRNIKHPFLVEPSYMVLDDSCYFNTMYHVNRSGVMQNTSHIIKVMREHINAPKKEMP